MAENWAVVGDDDDKCDSAAVASFQQEAPIGSEGVSYHQTAGVLHVLLNRLSKWCIAATYCGVVLLRHDGVAAWVVVGSVLNILLSFTLKQIVNQERPAAEVCSGPGMPSSHAQSISFTVVYIILSIIGCLGLNAFSASIGGIVVAAGVYFSWLRVLLRYHTSSQVVVGAVVGSTFSLLWFCICDTNTMVVKAYIRCIWV